MGYEPAIARSRCGLTLIVVVLAPMLAQAQSAEDKSAAEALFQRGVKLLDEKDYARACRLLETSQRLDPGIGTLLYLADCYASSGRTASAWATFREAASAARAAGQGEREAIASRRAAELEPDLARVLVEMSPANDMPGFTLERDGALVPNATWETPIPVDPGDHLFRASASGFRTWSGTARAEPGETARVRVPELQPVDLVSGRASRARSARAQESVPTSSTQPTVGLIVAGVGLAGIGVGTYFGLRARSFDEQANHHCRPESPTKCNEQGVRLGDDAANSATASTVAFGAGAAALATGLVLWLTAPAGSKSTNKGKVDLRFHASTMPSVPGVVGMEGAW